MIDFAILNLQIAIHIDRRLFVLDLTCFGVDQIAVTIPRHLHFLHCHVNGEGFAIRLLGVLGCLYPIYPIFLAAFLEIN